MARGRYPTRIHVEPPDEQTAAKYYLNWTGRQVYNQHHHFPALTSRGIFGNNHPLEIDFGCGTGMFTCNRANNQPRCNVLGIDKSYKSIYYAVQSAANAALDNIRFLRGDFGVLLPLLQPCTLQTAYYLFPTPPNDYRIDRANMRRQRFLNSIFSALVPGGTFYFVTDSKPFFDNLNGIINKVPQKIISRTGCDINDLCTDYHRIWKRDGRSVRSISIEKT